MVIWWVNPINGWFIMENPKKTWMIRGVPSGKHTKNDGKIRQFVMGKFTISMTIFNSYVKLPEGIPYLILKLGSFPIK